MLRSQKLYFLVTQNLCNIDPLILNGQLLDFVTEWKYLGTTIAAGKTVTFSSQPELASFYRSFNSLFSSMQKPNELVLMNLLYSNCVPNLTYNAEVKDVSAITRPTKELQELNTALNNAIRRIFSYNRWESVRHLRQQLSFPNVTEIFRNRRRKFLTKCTKLDNDAVRFVITNCDIVL